MSSRDLSEIIEPLVRHQVFSSVEEAARSLVRDRILVEIDRYRGRIAALEQRHAMSFEQFSVYLKERSALLADGQLDAPQKQKVAQALMNEEEDWLDWKVAREFLEAWLGLKGEATA
jgi:hypothetical protein